MERLVSEAVVASGGALNHFTAGLVTVVLEQGWQDQYLAFLKETFRTRGQPCLSGAVRHHFPSRSFHEPQGGYFIWLELPEHVDTEATAACGTAQRVSFSRVLSFLPIKRLAAVCDWVFLFMSRLNWSVVSPTCGKHYRHISNNNGIVNLTLSTINKAAIRLKFTNRVDISSR